MVTALLGDTHSRASVVGRRLHERHAQEVRSRPPGALLRSSPAGLERELQTSPRRPPPQLPGVRGGRCAEPTQL